MCSFFKTKLIQGETRRADIMIEDIHIGRLCGERRN